MTFPRSWVLMRLYTATYCCCEVFHSVHHWLSKLSSLGVPDNTLFLQLCNVKTVLSAVVSFTLHQSRGFLFLQQNYSTYIVLSPYVFSFVWVFIVANRSIFISHFHCWPGKVTIRNGPFFWEPSLGWFWCSLPSFL